MQTFILNNLRIAIDSKPPWLGYLENSLIVLIIYMLRLEKLLGEDLDYLDGEHCVFGEIVEGWETLNKINGTICDGSNRPYQVRYLK